MRYNINEYTIGGYNAVTASFSEARSTIENYYSKCDFQHDFYLAIVEKGSTNIIGAIVLTQNFFMKHYDCCYFIAQAYRRNGFMEEALRAFLHNLPVLEHPILFQIEENNADQ